ncbi:MAG: 50S ribosomal protein L25 [Myxococcales bacterium]|nr:50S ribosomal protein L25 [Myxococcales bacterium]
MKTIDISLRARHLGGSGVSKKIRRAGLIPGVLYGKGTESTMVAAEPRALTKALNSDFGRNQLLNLTVAGTDKSFLAICRDVQIHPVSRRLIHADFFSIEPTQKIQLMLPIRLTGRSAGEKIGGRLVFVRRSVKVECTAETLPAAIELALEPYQNGDMVGVEELPFPEGVRPIYRKAFKIFEIKAAREAREEDEDGEVAVAAE